MKKLLFTFITLLCVLLQLHASNDFDPTNPPEPGATKYYKLTLSCYPANAASVYGGGNIEQGTSAYIYTYPNNSMKFVGWKKGDELISSSSSFYYVPEADTELIAYYVFEPDSPGEPNPENPKYWLHISTTPSNGGYTNITSGKVVAESSVYLYAYTHAGFTFTGWSVNGKIVCTTPGFNYTMDNKDVSITATYRYEPTGPGEPDSEITTACYLSAPDMEAYPSSVISYPVSLTNMNRQVGALQFEVTLPKDVTILNVTPTGRLNKFTSEWKMQEERMLFYTTSPTDTITGAEGIVCFIAMQLPSHWTEGESHEIGFSAITTNENENLAAISGKLKILKNEATGISPQSESKIRLSITDKSAELTNHEGIVAFEVYSVSGHKVLEQSGSNKLSLHALSQGIYLIKAITGTQILVKKTIIR